MAFESLLDWQLKIRGPEGQRTFENAGKGLERFAQDLSVAISPKQINPIIARILKKHLKLVFEAMRQRHSTPYQHNQSLPEGAATGKLAIRSGRGLSQMKRSIKIFRKEGKVEGQIGGPFYFVTQEDGKEISGKRTKAGFMAIPLPDALTSQGIPIRPSVRSWENTFLIPSRQSSGGFLVVQRRGARLLFLYKLQKTVVIPPRLGLGETLRTAEPALVEKVLNALTIHIATKAVTGRSTRIARG